jgi:hypothetical protein
MAIGTTWVTPGDGQRAIVLHTGEDADFIADLDTSAAPDGLYRRSVEGATDRVGLSGTMSMVGGDQRFFASDNVRWRWGPSIFSSSHIPSRLKLNLSFDYLYLLSRTGPDNQSRR